MLKQKKILITLVILLIVIIEACLLIFLSHQTKKITTLPTTQPSVSGYQQPVISPPAGGLYKNDFSLGQFIISKNNLDLLTTAQLEKVYSKNNVVYIEAVLMNIGNAKKVNETFITSIKNGKSFTLAKQKDSVFLTENQTIDTNLIQGQIISSLQPYLKSNVKFLLPMYTSVFIGTTLGTNPTITITPPVSPDASYVKCNAALSQAYKNNTDLPQCVGIISTIYVYTSYK